MDAPQLPQDAQIDPDDVTSSVAAAARLVALVSVWLADVALNARARDEVDDAA